MKKLIILLCASAGLAASMADTNFSVSSNAFGPNEYIPSKYTCEGQNINPDLVFNAVPSETVSLAIIMDDPDAPGKTFTHWLVWNIPVVKAVGENTNPGITGTNSNGTKGYFGPCPPSGSHRYVFHVYALNAMLEIPEGAERKTLESEIRKHLVSSAELTGLYRK